MAYDNVAWTAAASWRSWTRSNIIMFGMAGSAKEGRMVFRPDDAFSPQDGWRVWASSYSTCLPVPCFLTLSCLPCLPVSLPPTSLSTLFLFSACYTIDSLYAYYTLSAAFLFLLCPCCLSCCSALCMPYHLLPTLFSATYLCFSAFPPHLPSGLLHDLNFENTFVRGILIFIFF